MQQPSGIRELDRIVRSRELRNFVGLSRSTIWRLERAGLFPHHIRLGPRAIGWRLSEILGWLNRRAHNGSTDAQEVER